VTPVAESPRASVVLPVKDGGEPLRELLAALAAQDLPGGLEVVAIDSGSRDGSLEALAQRGARVVVLEPERFDHGSARNLGARFARGETLVFLSQDALPEGAGCVRRLVERLDSDPRLAGVFARQQPRADADAVTRHELAGWVTGGEAARAVFAADLEAARTPFERYRIAAFDDVASALRRRLLLEHPFEATPFGEDVEWGLRMLRLGWGLGFEPKAVVRHSHARSVSGLYRRNYLGHRTLQRLFGLETVPDAPKLVRAALAAAASDVRLLLAARSGARALAAAPARALAGVYGQYRGARDERLGRPYPAWAGWPRALPRAEAA
jgi:rhamnosyltransferase